MATKQYDLRTRNGGTIWSLIVPVDGGINKVTLYNLSASNGMPIVHEADLMIGTNHRTNDFHIYPDPRCGDFEAELTAAMDAHLKVPLAEQKYALIERAALQETINRMRAVADLEANDEINFCADDLEALMIGDAE